MREVKALRRLTGPKKRLNRALLSAVVGTAVLAIALKRRGARAMLALMVVSSVAVVGYLPSAIASSPGEDSVLPRKDHSSTFSAVPFVSTEAVVSLMSDCSSCHDMKAAEMSTKPFPPIPHRTEGWGQCSFCHAPARLAPPPESHEGLPDILCQACHQVSTMSPPSLGHVLWRDKTCSSCHRTSLDLPVSHDDRGDLTCALCHEPAKVDPPLVPHSATEGGLCAGCHAQGDISVAEPRHASWGNDQCTTCHTADPAGVPTVPHVLDNRTECRFCHQASPSGERPGLQPE